MNKKTAAVLFAATMLTTPAFAASVASSPNAAAVQTATPDKVTKTSDKVVKKHRVHARTSHAHKVRHAKHAKPNQVKHVNETSKKSPTSASTKSDAETVGAAPAKAPIKN